MTNKLKYWLQEDFVHFFYFRTVVDGVRQNSYDFLMTAWNVTPDEYLNEIGVTGPSYETLKKYGTLASDMMDASKKAQDWRSEQSDNYRIVVQ